jgi:predicted amidohydrolase
LSCFGTRSCSHHAQRYVRHAPTSSMTNPTAGASGSAPAGGESGRLRVAAFQAPYLPFGSFEAIGLIKRQLAVCEAAGVDVLCCPEAVIGGLAHESDGQSPAAVALGVHDGELSGVLAPLMDTAVAVIVGFTERDAAGRLFNAAAVIADRTLVGTYRKVFPGYRTVFQAGSELPVFHLGTARFGVMICNDIWYLEPARVLAARGAAVVFVPSNSGHIRDLASAGALRARGATLPIARAVENTATVVVADIAGRQGDRAALGCTVIVDPDGIVLAKADAEEPGLIIADVKRERRRTKDPRGWDGPTNAAVTQAFVDLWRAGD